MEQEITDWFVSVCLCVAGQLLAQGQLEDSLQSGFYSAVCLVLEEGDKWVKKCKVIQQQSNQIENRANL